MLQRYRQMTENPLFSGFLLLFLAGFATLMVAQWRFATGSTMAVAQQVRSEAAELKLRLSDAETRQRAYMLSGDPRDLAAFEASRNLIFSAYDALGRTVASDPHQAERVHQLRRAIESRLADLLAMTRYVKLDQRDQALALMRGHGGQSSMDDARRILDAILTDEARHLEQMQGDLLISGWLTRGGLIASLMLATFMAVQTQRRSEIQLRELSQSNAALEEAYASLQRETESRLMTEQALRQAQKMEALGSLTGGISHDFNNMLAIVIGSLDMLSRRMGPDAEPRLMRLIDNAMSGANRAATLTQRLLSFARMQPLEPQTLDVGLLVNGMVELLRRTLGEMVELKTTIAPALWRTRADPGQLENAIVNLAVNARDAMPGGGLLTLAVDNIEIAADVSQTIQPGAYVRLRVTDTGMGMSADIISRAFDPFFTTKGVGKGTGLGLSQVYGFVTQTGGHIDISSQPGSGTTIAILLPRDSEPATRADDVGQIMIETSLPHARNGEVILVVEDEDDVRQMSCDALRELGYDVISAGSGPEALERAAGHARIDLLFSDIVMPGMTGGQLAQTMRLERPGLPVLYVTGYAADSRMLEDPETGAVFLTKPFTHAQLAQKVRQVLDAGVSSATT